MRFFIYIFFVNSDVIMMQSSVREIVQNAIFCWGWSAIKVFETR